jgi:hypothetical protein
MKIRSYPTIQLFAAGANEITANVIAWKLDTADTLKTFGIEVDKEKLKKVQAMTSLLRKGKNSKLPTRPAYIKRSKVWPQKTKQQLYDDAYLSFDFNLRNGVFMTKDCYGRSCTCLFRTSTFWVGDH